jgi:hypothetical protein
MDTSVLVGAVPRRERRGRRRRPWFVPMAWISSLWQRDFASVRYAGRRSGRRTVSGISAIGHRMKRSEPHFEPSPWNPHGSEFAVHKPRSVGRQVGWPERRFSGCGVRGSCKSPDDAS